MLSENLTQRLRKIVTSVIAVLLIVLVVLPAQAQEPNKEKATPFTSKDDFAIPALNGNVKFGFNGSYQEAKLENNTWIFRGLELNNTQATAAYGFPDVESIKKLQISAEDSNVTVLGCVSFNYSWTAQVIMYTVEGYGTQIVNLGINPTERTGVDEWSVLVDNGATFLAEGSGWNLLHDNSVQVNVGGGNVTVMHFDFNDPSMANLSFIMQHYVAVVTVVVLAVVMVLAALIAFKTRRRKKIANQTLG
jgi:hypothetical protein